MIPADGVQNVAWDIAVALNGANVAQWRRDIITARLADCQRRERRKAEELDRAYQENRDLRHHLKDRDAHIANLEAQLRPHLQPSVTIERGTLL